MGGGGVSIGQDKVEHIKVLNVKTKQMEEIMQK